MQYRPRARSQSRAKAGPPSSAAVGPKKRCADEKDEIDEADGLSPELGAPESLQNSPSKGDSTRNHSAGLIWPMVRGWCGADTPVRRPCRCSLPGMLLCGHRATNLFEYLGLS